MSGVTPGQAAYEAKHLSAAGRYNGEYDYVPWEQLDEADIGERRSDWDIAAEDAAEAYAAIATQQPEPGPESAATPWQAQRDEAERTGALPTGYTHCYHRHFANSEVHRDGAPECTQPGTPRRVYVFDPDALDEHERIVAAYAAAHPEKFLPFGARPLAQPAPGQAMDVTVNGEPVPMTTSGNSVVVPSEIAGLLHQPAPGLRTAWRLLEETRALAAEILDAFAPGGMGWSGFANDEVYADWRLRARLDPS